MAGHQPLREEVYVERLITSLAYHRTEDEAATVAACREMQQLTATPELLFFLLNHPHFQAKGLAVLTSLLEDPTSEKAHAAISVLSDLASDTQGASFLLNPQVMTMDPFAVVAMAYAAIGRVLAANISSDDRSVRAGWDAVHVLYMLIPQTRGFTAVQNLPVDEFRVVMTALVGATQRRWPSKETGIVEITSVASASFFSSGAKEELSMPRLAHPMDHSVAEEACLVLQFISEQLTLPLADSPSYQDPEAVKERLQGAMLFFHRSSSPECTMERPDVTPWLLGLRRDLTHGDATSQGVACRICRAIVGGKELVRVLMVGGSEQQTMATVALIGCMITRVSASPEDVFHAVRAAGRIGFYDDAHSAFVDLAPSLEVEAVLHGLFCVVLEALPVDSRGSSYAATHAMSANKQAAATVCAATEAIKMLLGGTYGVELVTGLLEATTGEQRAREASDGGGMLSWISGGFLTSSSGEIAGANTSRGACTSEAARTAIMTAAFFALMCVTAVPTAGTFAAEALHALSCCPAGAVLLLKQPTSLLTCSVQGLILLLHPDNSALVFAVEVVAGIAADTDGLLAIRGLPHPEAISLMTRLQAVSFMGADDPVSQRCTWAASNTLKVLVAEGYMDAYLSTR